MSSSFFERGGSFMGPLDDVTLRQLKIEKNKSVKKGCTHTAKLDRKCLCESLNCFCIGNYRQKKKPNLSQLPVRMCWVRQCHHSPCATL